MTDGILKTPSFRLQGKKALVTGAGSGIGQACAVALAEYGAHVTMVGRRLEPLQETLSMVQHYTNKARILTLDVSQIDDMQAFIAKEGPFDILLNAAGVARHSPALATKEDEFELVCDTNFKAAYFLSQAVAKSLIEHKKSGSLIHISSQMAHVGGIDRAVYSGTKHAVEGITKSMAIEWGQYGIRINTICPTFIKTALTAPTFSNPERVKWIEDKIKLGRIGEVEDIMGAVVFLASDASNLITGSALMIDGGWTAE